jgi:hypothetical protein
MNIPGKIASIVLILIGAGWLVSLFSPWAANNNNGNNGRATNNLGVATTNQGLGLTPAGQNPATVGTNNMTTPLKTALTGNTTPAQVAAAQAVAQTTAVQTPAATPVPNQVAGAAQTNQAVVVPGTGTQQFEASPRSATAPVTPVPVVPATPAPVPITEPVRAGW